MNFCLYLFLNFFCIYWITDHLVYADLGLLMKSCIDQGQLVPDDVISRLILSSLRGIERTSWLLDGTTLTPLKHAFAKHTVDVLHGSFMFAPHSVALCPGRVSSYRGSGRGPGRRVWRGLRHKPRRAFPDHQRASDVTLGAPPQRQGL